MTTAEATGTEAAVFGTSDVDAIRATLDAYARAHLGSCIRDVLFRAGRVDAVWAIRLDDAREVVVKAHRQPVDLVARLATVEAQRFLAGGGFPCPMPLVDTVEFRGLVLTTESLVTAGAPADARDPAVRRSLAAGLADQIRLLRDVPGLVARAGRGPAWWRFERGPWPTPHDPIFDFGVTPPEYRWLDDFAARAADRLNSVRGLEVVVGHADWYVGNTRFAGATLVGTFDWDLVAAPEAQIAGFAAATFTDGGSGPQDLPRPPDVAAFLREYAAARGEPFGPGEQEQSAAAASWALAYNARCQLAFLAGAPTPAPGSALDLLQEHAAEYLQLRW